MKMEEEKEKKRREMIHTKVYLRIIPIVIPYDFSGSRQWRWEFTIARAYE